MSGSNNGYQNAFNDYGLPPEEYYKSTKNPNKLLYYASRFNDMSFIYSLEITNPNVSEYDDNYKCNMCPLSYACMHKNMKLFKWLLSFETIDVNFTMGKDPLIHVLLERNQLDYVKLLLPHPNLDLNLENSIGDSAVYIAVKYFDNDPTNYLKIIKKMIQTDKTITRSFNRKNIFKYAFDLSDTSECNELLMLLYKYQKLPNGRAKDYIESLLQFKDARHFIAYVSNKPQLSRVTKKAILGYLTEKKTRRLNRTFENTLTTPYKVRNGKKK